MRKIRDRMEGKERFILLTGIAHFAQYLADAISNAGSWKMQFVDLSIADFPFLRRVVTTGIAGFKLLQADLWYQIGGWVWNSRMYKVARKIRLPVVIHWAGSDVLLAKQTLQKDKRFSEKVKGVVHWAGAPWLVDELQDLGIESEFVPLPLKLLERSLAMPPPSLPAKFTVLSYFSDARPELYRSNYIMRLSRDFPDVLFLIVGSKKTHFSEKFSNVKFLGWVGNMYDVYTMATVVVRMTEHDGYGGTVQEGLSMGRYAIWNYPFQGAIVAKDYDTLRQHLMLLLDSHRKGNLGLNTAGRKYLQENMQPSKLTQDIVNRISSILNSCNQVRKRSWLSLPEKK
jgi:hypothetical protein